MPLWLGLIFAAWAAIGTGYAIANHRAADELRRIKRAYVEGSAIHTGGYDYCLVTLHIRNDAAGLWRISAAGTQLPAASRISLADVDEAPDGYGGVVSDYKPANWTQRVELRDNSNKVFVSPSSSRIELAVEIAARADDTIRRSMRVAITLTHI